MSLLSLLVLTGCAIEPRVSDPKADPDGGGDSAAGVDTAGGDDSGDTGDRGDGTVPGDDTATPDGDTATQAETGDTGSGAPDTGGPDTGGPDTGAPPDVDTPAPDIPCLTDVLDASPCVAGVAAWNSGTSTTYATVQDAVDDAASGDTVAVCAGTWSENVEILAGTLTLRGYGDTTTEIDGGAAGSVVSVPGSTTLTLQDLALTGGRGQPDGGGLYAPGADLLTCGVRFEDDVAVDGGGVYHGAGSWLGEDVSFVGNYADYEGGGAVGGEGVVLVAATFTDDEAGYDGGGMALSTELDAELWDSAFSTNVAANGGGGIKTNGSRGGGSVTLTRVTFTGNEAGYSGGGLGSEGWDAMSYQLEDCTFDANTAAYEGGAVDLSTWGADTLVATGSTFTGNSSQSGGAFDLGGWGDQTVELTDCTVDGNVASSSAGAFAMANRGTATLVITGGAVTSNSARSGGGMTLDADATVTVTTSDWGTGATDNLPDDAPGYPAWGAGASFTCAGTVCR